MAKQFQNLDEAIEAQEAQAKKIKETKSLLTAYYKKHKLNRLEDYGDDAKHGPKIKKLQTQVDNENELLTQINSQMAKLDKSGKKTAAKKAEKVEKGPAKVATKYEYPADIDTPEKRKKYRIEQRKLANGGEAKPKKEKAAKTEAAPKSEKASKSTKDTAKVEGKKTSTKKVKEAPAKEEAPAKKKVAKKVKKSDD